MLYRSSIKHQNKVRYYEAIMCHSWIPGPDSRMDLEDLWEVKCPPVFSNSPFNSLLGFEESPWNFTFISLLHPVLTLTNLFITFAIFSSEIKNKSPISPVFRFDSDGSSYLIVLIFNILCSRSLCNDVCLIRAAPSVFYSSPLWFVPRLLIMPCVRWCIAGSWMVVQFIVSWWLGLSSHLTACHPYNGGPSITSTNTHKHTSVFKKGLTWGTSATHSIDPWIYLSSTDFILIKSVSMFM